jgi:hypothetical protein
MQVYYWIIGRDNRNEPPDVAIDLYDDDGNRMGQTYTQTITGRHHVLMQAHYVANTYARKHGATRINYDPDSTECNRND